jgi:hypothetical protein
VAGLGGVAYYCYPRVPEYGIGNASSGTFVTTPKGFAGLSDPTVQNTLTITFVVDAWVKSNMNIDVTIDNLNIQATFLDNGNVPLPNFNLLTNTGAMTFVANKNNTFAGPISGKYTMVGQPVPIDPVIVHLIKTCLAGLPLKTTYQVAINSKLLQFFNIGLKRTGQFFTACPPDLVRGLQGLKTA